MIRGKVRRRICWEQSRGQSFCLLFTASGEKKEGWSWESYLEEQKAVTAPVSLFQDVSRIISTWEELVCPGQELTTKLVYCVSDNPQKKTWPNRRGTDWLGSQNRKGTHRERLSG